MKIEDCFKVGYISKTHGLKGEVTAVLESDFELEIGKPIFLEKSQNLVPYFIERVSGTADKIVIQFESIYSLEGASHLKGNSIYLPKSERAKSGKGEFYDDEVVGFLVTDENMGELGPVKEVVSNKLSRIITVNFHHREVLIPVNSPFIKSINKTKKTIAVSLPDGYLEI